MMVIFGDEHREDIGGRMKPEPLPLRVGSSTPQVCLLEDCLIHCQDEINVADDGTFRFARYKVTFTRLE